MRFQAITRHARHDDLKKRLAAQMKELEEKEKQRQQSEASVQRSCRHLNRGLEGVGGLGVIAWGSFTLKWDNWESGRQRYKGESGRQRYK